MWSVKKILRPKQYVGRWLAANREGKVKDDDRRCDGYARSIEVRSKMTDDEQIRLKELKIQEAAGVARLRELLGQPGSEHIVGWSTRDCLDSQLTSAVAKQIEATRKLMKPLESKRDWESLEKRLWTK